MKHYLFTSESVSQGHPDKIADQISDAILDACLTVDQEARVACETLVSQNLVVLAGEISVKVPVDYKKIVRDTIKNIGYTKPEMGFDYRSCEILITISPQSKEIAQGIDKNIYNEQGAGDQGIMFGFACDETPELMPLPIMLAHRIIRELRYRREQNILPYLGLDGKSQVTVEYDEHNNPLRVHTVVISAQHDESTDLETMKNDFRKLAQELAPEWIDDKTLFYINPTGRFVLGGPHVDSGLTGRKIIVDTYGGMGRHGGGAFSGKDASKVDRSASYAARYIAKNIVAAKLARRCEVQLAYAIGVPFPISIKVDTFGSHAVSEELLSTVIPMVFNLKPKGIIDMLDLKRPIFHKTAFEGHFGRTEEEFTWEKTDRAQALLDAIKQESYTYTLASNRQIKKNFANVEEKDELEKEKRLLEVYLRRRYKKNAMFKEKILKQLKECQNWEQVQKEGELLKSNFPALKKGLHQIVVMNWETEKEEVIALDSSKSPSELVSERFKRAKKLFRGIPHLQEQVVKVDHLNEKIEQDLKRLNGSTKEEIEELKLLWKAGKKVQSKKKSTEIPKPYHEFQSSTGVKIWVGKNARNNEKLTFSFAKGSDWWLHVQGYPGSHVIIKTEKGAEPDHETLLDAIQLALHHSKAKNQGEGEICVTQRKYVSRFGKGAVGKVQISKHKTLFAKLDPKRYQALLTLKKDL